MDSQIDRIWKNVRQNPTDFISWTNLLDTVSRTNNIELIRDAFGPFLLNYPYCFGYWRKYADFEHKLSSPKKAIRVLERAVSVFPLCVDLWIQYLNMFIELNKNHNSSIKDLFEKSLNACGEEFRSDHVWMLYLSWLYDNQQFSSIVTVYDRLLAVPSLKHSEHFSSFESFVNKFDPKLIIDKLEYDNHLIEFKNNNSNQKIEVIIGQSSINGFGGSNFIDFGKENSYEQTKTKTKTYTEKSIIKSCDGLKETENSLEMDFVRSNIIKKRKLVYEKTEQEIKERITFEEMIKRPYFHVNPIDILQLNNWMEYLNWEIKRECRNKIILLFERCLITCALYEQMWIKYVNYLIIAKDDFIIDDECIRKVFKRGCMTHVKKSLKLHYLWSLFEERNGNVKEALNILEMYHNQYPDAFEVEMYKINLYHRLGDFEKVKSLFNDTIKNSLKTPSLSSHISIRFSRFVSKVLRDPKEAAQILMKALDVDSTNHTLYLQLIDISLQQNTFDANEILTLFDKSINVTPSKSVKCAMIRRKVEFMQDFGCGAHLIHSSLSALHSLMQDITNDLVSTKDISYEKSPKKFKSDSSQSHDEFPDEFNGKNVKNNRNVQNHFINYNYTFNDDQKFIPNC